MFEPEVNPESVEKAELVVAIPSYNEADSIAFPVQQADRGIETYFGDRQSVIINCDNNSNDGTREIFLGIRTATPKIYISTEPGEKGKGRNLRNLFRKVVDLEASGVVVVDADLKSITPKWIKHLGEPLFQDFGYVAPLYVRHKYDGTITNSIAYPLTRALYGRRVRQPIGGDFGFSGELAQVYLQNNDWSDAVANFGIDIWMTTLAMNQNVPICQMMIQFYTFWSQVKWSKPTSIFGFGLGETELPPPVNVNTENLFHRFQEASETYGPVWERVIQREVFHKLQEVRKMGSDRFDFPTPLWINILIDYSIGYRDKVWQEDELLNSLIPLYLGKTLSYVRKTERMSIRESEEFIEEECVQFEATKSLMVQRWNK
jgi:glycosyltransferase involved in cell wall biosynthesis